MKTLYEELRRVESIHESMLDFESQANSVRENLREVLPPQTPIDLLGKQIDLLQEYGDHPVLSEVYQGEYCLEEYVQDCLAPLSGIKRYLPLPKNAQHNAALEEVKDILPGSANLRLSGWTKEPNKTPLLLSAGIGAAGTAGLLTYGAQSMNNALVVAGVTLALGGLALLTSMGEMGIYRNTQNILSAARYIDTVVEEVGY